MPRPEGRGNFTYWNDPSSQDVPLADSLVNRLRKFTQRLDEQQLCVNFAFKDGGSQPPNPHVQIMTDTTLETEGAHGEEIQDNIIQSAEIIYNPHKGGWTDATINEAAQAAGLRSDGPFMKNEKYLNELGNTSLKILYHGEAGTKFEAGPEY